MTVRRSKRECKMTCVGIDPGISGAIVVYAL